jgi:hypothetical protein
VRRGGAFLSVGRPLRSVSEIAAIKACGSVFVLFVKILEKVSAKLANLRNGVLRNVAEVLISIRRTKNFFQSGDFGEEIF